MRNKILELLKERELTKTQMAEDIDYTTQQLLLVIKGKSKGSKKFWRNFQKAYGISDEEIKLYKQEG